MFQRPAGIGLGVTTEAGLAHAVGMTGFLARNGASTRSRPDPGWLVVQGALDVVAQGDH
jgi:hypothetical protein